MSNVKIIESLKAELLCTMGDLFKLLTKGSNVDQNEIADCISREIIILYMLAEKLGFSYMAIDEDMKLKLKEGILEDGYLEKEGKDLTRLYVHIKERN